MLFRSVMYLEAFGRTLCGLAPWLELGEDNTEEGQLRKEYISLTLKAIKNAVDPKSQDTLNWDGSLIKQPLVDAAYLCEGLLHARTQLLERLDSKTRDNLIARLKETRNIKPNESNWQLFACNVEALLLEMTGECDSARLWRGINKFMQTDWYKGDAMYGDGPEVHLDYYNSLVIHPMQIGRAHV